MEIRKIEDIYELSPVQQGILFHNLFAPEADMYCIQLRLSLRGRMNVEAFRRAWQQALARHTALRTSFHWDNLDKPLQVVHRDVALPLVECDWRDVPAPEQQERLQHYLQQDRQRSFELADAPLMRLALFRTATDAQEFVWSHHHLILDGWSVALVLKEVFACYEAFALGGTLNLEPTRPYGEYVAWLQGQEVAQSEAFWRELLKGMDAPTTLRVERSPSAALSATEDFARRQKHFSASTTSALQAFARRNQLTLNTVLQGAWALLLSRYSGASDVVFGTVVADRAVGLRGAEWIVGPVINTLPLRVETRSGAALVPWLKDLQARLAQMRHYSSTPLAQIQGWSDVPRGTPLFETAFAFENYPIDASLRGQRGGLEIAEVGHVSRTNYALAVVAVPDSELVIRMTYDTRRFESDTISRMLGHIEALLEGMLAQVEQTLGELSLPTKSEREEMLVGWNRTEREFAQANCAHQLFEKQVEDTPEALALVHEGQRMTYRELNERANRLAHYLRSLGVGPDVLVGVCVERSVEMVIAFLGVLKAGGAYVPLDPNYPIERLSFMLQDAAAAIVLTQESPAERLPAHWGQVIFLDSEHDLIDRESRENPATQISSDNLAYVIYTSGSTGRPKGTLITHKGLCNTIGAQKYTFRLGEGSRLTQLASFSFDASIFEMTLALSVGATLYLSSRESSLPGSSLLGLLRDEEITAALFSPSSLMALPEESLPTLQTIIVAGEACPLALIKRWGGGRRFFNAYGPAEASIWATVVRCCCEDEKVTIGHPIANTKIYLLDPELRPVPVGVPGELHISGEGLCRGYLNRPDLTAERFIPNPFDALPGARLYRTGDVARYLKGGEIEFLGRLDRQVKIRGYRVETGEVESALRTYPGVREAVVIGREAAPGDRRLAAYLVADDAGVPGASDLRAYLLSKLPEYMVPATFVTLEALPLTPNGKVDLRALPEAESSRRVPEKNFIAPRTPLEKFLSQCWREILVTQEVGIHDDFFDLGGDSIKAAILSNRLQEHLGEIVHVVAVFDAPTVAQLSDYLYEHNPRPVLKLFGERPSEPTRAKEEGTMAAAFRASSVEPSMVAHMRQLITPLPSRPAAEQFAGVKNPPAIFVLSAPRSGSTLFRVMLGGSPALFAPPELELLSFNTLRERREAFVGRNSFWLEGAIRALMEMNGSDAEAAALMMEEFEREDMTTREFYRLLQEGIGERRLVDKTPSYALDMEILRRAERDFESAFYIHLVRHPAGMIRSFEEARIDQILTRYPHPFSTRQFAELVWTISQQNIQEFLNDIPAHRQCRVKFEDLVREPQTVLEEVCRFLGISPHPDMLQPYKEKKRRMTDGLHAASRMLGDVKFHTHQQIDASAAEAWRSSENVASPSAVTWQVAESLGYICGGAGDENPAGGAEVLKPIQPIESYEEIALPLSFAQQRLWFLDQLELGSLSYNCAGAARLVGSLNVEAFRESLDEIVRRHAALRTTFPVVNGQPHQVISSARSMPLSLLMRDLGELPAADAEGEVQRLVHEESTRPFDLALGPLLRMVLLRLSAEEHVFILTMHHIVSDGWSIGIFMRELASLYAAFTSGLPSPLPPLPIQYADYACWQRTHLNGPAFERQLAYWRNHLSGAPTMLALGGVRSEARSWRGGRQRLEIERETVVALRALAQSEGATLFMMLLASYRVVLSRWSGQAEVVVGTPIAGRVRVEVEGLIGFFVNTLGLRGEVRERESVREMLRREREVCLGGYGAQEVPFEKVVEEMEPERSLTHSPIFQVFFNLLNARDNDFELSGLTIEMLGDEVPATKFDITLYARERESGLHLEMVYNADLFDQELMVEMLEQYALLLRSVAREPDAPLMNHSLVTLQAEAVLPRASAPLSAGWDGAVQSGFDRQASLNPERIAVRDSFGAWTYAQLGVGSNDLARRLRAGGIRRGEVVAVYAHRSASLVRALLGVLKAGAAFVILDPAYPAARLIECLKVAKPRGWIQLEAAGELPEQLEAFLRGAGYRCRITLPKTLEREGDESGRESLVGDSEESVTEPDDPAYIAFTSGSTGEPKGVLGSHRPLSHFLHWHVGTFGLQASDRFTLLSGLSHDPLLRDIFTPLRLGATLCIPDEEKMAAPGELLAWMRHEAVTVTHLTPAMAQWLAGARPGANRNGDGSLPALPLLRYAFFGGDVLTAREVSLMRELSGSVTCVNFYGTTETPQAMAYHIVEPLDTSKARDESLPDGRQIIPLGRGIADVQLLLLNGAQQPAGIGELGEIYVRTPYLSQGYAGEATATAERFIINPATGRSKDLYYRTGDLGRYLPGGEVMFVGRADRQVKIRGFRVEPGEVEAALGEHASVRAAAVKAYEDASGAQCLVAYVAPRAGSTPTINDLHNSLRERLPGHMIPSNIVCLDEMPLTPNGKIDYGALPTPDLTNPATGKEFIAPRTPVEIQMSEIWSEVLGVARVGINDNFFTLGGHSLLATQVVSRMRESFDVDLSLRALFKEPTVEALALTVTQMHLDAQDDEELAHLLAEIEHYPADALRSTLIADTSTEKEIL